MADVWITFDTPDDCMCWRDTICTHDWTWQERDPTCRHGESFEGVHRSFADAVRDLFKWEGAAAVGCLLRQRYRSVEFGQHKTSTVYVMRRGDAPFADDHNAPEGGPAPLAIITRHRIEDRSTPRADAGDIRHNANQYR